MKTVSMLEFRKYAAQVLRRVAKGEQFVLTRSGKPVARLEPLGGKPIAADDPIYSLAELASDSAEPLTNTDVDRFVYWKRRPRKNRKAVR
ncbi:MAG TPA: type II toxin-antitoxin system prevent-host-death family antitoxin [Pirellulaceae bacterium]|nr:type II toxin-antitoxin system prevent-host-death family antitoxin [Pirellulaceae bacterium]